jgi:hypothetical protein
MEMNSVSVIHHPHPILPAADVRFVAHGWKSGETVREILKRSDFDQHQEMVVVLDDRLLTVAEWDSVCPQAGQIINAKAVVSGGGGDDGGSNVGQILMLVVAVVVAIFAPELGGWAAGMLGGGEAGALGLTVGQLGSIVGAVIVAGAGMIVSTFAPSGRALSQANGVDSAGANTPNYSLSGGSNSLRPYEPMPVVMGRHRIFPDYGSKPYVEYRGNDQYLYQIFNFGLSAISLADFKIGNTDIGDYQDVEFRWSDASGRISGFPGNVDSTAGAALVGGTWITRTSSVDTTRIAVDIEGQVYYSGDSGLLPCYAVVEAYYSAAGAESWQPMAVRNVVSYSTHYWSLLDSNGIQHAFANSGHYEGESQLIREAFNDGENAIPDLYATWTLLSFEQAKKIGILATPDPVPTYSTSYSTLIDHGASQSAQRKTLAMDVPAGQYDVKVRLSRVYSSKGEIADGDSRGGFSYAWTVLRSYQEDDASYKGQTRIGMVIKASGQLNGVVQQLSALATAYCNVWTGSKWLWKPTRNVAWWYLDYAIGRKNADGEKSYGCHLDWSQIDVAEIKLWASFCDSEGLTFDAVLDRQQSAWDVLTTVARCGMASPTWASGKLGVTWDKKNDSPVAAFGMANIIKGSFSVQYITENLADEIIVSFVDADRDWQQDQVRVTVPGVVNPQRPSTVEMMGCTSAAMAGKFANYLAAQQVYRKRQISWEADFEGFTCQRGDVIILSHDLTQWGYSGRLVEASGATLTLNKKVPRSGAAEYLMVVFPDGSMTTYTVTADTGEQDVITLSAPLVLQDDYGPIDHKWFFSPLPTPGKKVKVLSMRPVSQSRIAIVATDEDPAFYAAWEGAWSQADQNTLLTNPVPAVSVVDVREVLIAADGGGIMNRITASASISSSFDNVYWSYRFNGGSWTDVKTTGTNLVFDTAQIGAFEVSARATNGVFYGAPFVANVRILGESAKPADVQNLQSRISGSSLWMTYTPTTEVDVMMGGGGIKIRHASAVSGATWEAAADLYQGPAPASGITVPAMVGTYLAKFVDATGNESVNAALIVNEISLSLISMNVVDSINDAPGWAGTHASTRYDSGLSAVVLDASVLFDDAVSVDAIGNIDRFGGMSLSGTYALADTVDIGVVDTCRISGNITFACIDSGVDVDDIVDFDTFPDVDGVVPSGGSAKIQVSLSQDGTTFDAWADLFAGEARFRKIKARLALSSNQNNINVAVSAASITVDMPDRVDDGNDIVSGAAAYAVTYGRSFQVAPSLAITAQNMATGDYYTISSKTTAGFTVTFKNAAGTTVSRTFDFVAKGY